MYKINFNNLYFNIKSTFYIKNEFFYNLINYFLQVENFIFIDTQSRQKFV